MASAAGRDRGPSELDVLEIGCGRGGIALPLATFCRSVVAVDINHAAVAALERRAEAAGLGNLQTRVAAARRLESERSASYDVVVASEVFEHLLDPDVLARRCAELTAPGGLLVVTTPNGYGPWELSFNRLSPRQRLRRSNVARRRLGRQPYVRGTGADHCQFYTRRRLVGMLAEVGFRQVSFAKSNGLLAGLPGPMRRSHRLDRIDVRLADRLPSWLASGWYFAFERLRIG